HPQPAGAPGGSAAVTKRPLAGGPRLTQLLYGQLGFLVAALLLSCLPRSAGAASNVVEHQAWARTGPAAMAPVAPSDDRLRVAMTAGSETARSFIGFRPDVLSAGPSTLTMAVSADSVVPAGA